ncbi:MAG: PEP-CTERM sorting domain-containing protein [Oxalobacteraceae bacterium]|nr:MAG: PEP-CTERM sorting domain-containing protein [Oxalobacteraceae bacterium]
MAYKLAAFALLTTASVSSPALADTYFALGDSITFGETDLRYIPSNGDRGYVDDFANILAARSGGDRPDVVNLAIDGETSSSFFTGFGRTPPVVGRGDLPLALQNTNYSGAAPLSQSATFLQRAGEVTASGDTISTVSITLGFNELAALTSLPPAVGLASIGSTLDQYRTTYGAVLAQVRSVAPTADLYVLNYFNPFPGDDNAAINPATAIFAAGGVQLNSIIKELAAQYGGIYVDTFTPFVGREGELTFINEVGAGDTTPSPYSPTDNGLAPIGNVHPTEQGYAVIAQQLAASPGAVPEPSTWIMMLVGFGFVGAAMRYRRANTKVVYG